MKDSNTVIEEFNSIVNMTASELTTWLKSSDSGDAGWSKDDGSGETVGHDSGRKIVEILKANPKKNPDKYTEEQVEHMRKVVAYCKRHLAQEKSGNDEKSEEELKKTKSYMSLKNWGHDPLKGEGEGGASEGKGEEEDGDEEEEEEEVEDEEENGDKEDEEKQAGTKRKTRSSTQQGQNKKRQTRQGKVAQKKKDNEEDDDEEEEEETDEEEYVEDTKNGDAEEEEVDDDQDEDEKDNSKANKSNGSNGKKTNKGPKPGETVSWSWGSGNPEGKVLDVKEEKTTITTKRGNKVTRDGDEEDPAVVLDTGKSKAIKSNHELN